MQTNFDLTERRKNEAWIERCAITEVNGELDVIAAPDRLKYLGYIFSCGCYDPYSEYKSQYKTAANNLVNTKKVIETLIGDIEKSVEEAQKINLDSITITTLRKARRCFNAFATACGREDLLIK